MNYYKDAQNNIFAYSEIQTPADGLTKITEAEAMEILNPPEKKAEEVRAERDSLIEEVRWRIERAQDQAALNLSLTEPIEPLLLYVQQLRDVPQQSGFPDSIVWPVSP